jgi:hypothetical protein
VEYGYQSLQQANVQSAFKPQMVMNFGINENGIGISKISVNFMFGQCAATSHGFQANATQTTWN